MDLKNFWVVRSCECPEALDERACFAAEWVDSHRKSDAGMWAACPAAITRWLSVSNLIMSSMPLQPERRIWNLCPVLLANDLRNACQEQRKMGCSSSVLIVLALHGSKRVLLYWSPLAHCCSSAAELPLSTHTAQLDSSPQAGGSGNTISHPKLKALSGHAFTILTLHQRNAETKLKLMVSTWQCFRPVRGQGVKSLLSNGLPTGAPHFLQRVK